VFAPSIEELVVDDDVDEVDSSPARDITSWAVAGAVVNEMPPTAATATAPVPTTRATPENMATIRFGFMPLTVNSQASSQGQPSPKSRQSWLLAEGLVTPGVTGAIGETGPCRRVPSHESMR